MITWSHSHMVTLGPGMAQDIMVGVCRRDFSPQTPRMQEREELRVQHPFQLSFETDKRSSEGSLGKGDLVLSYT